MGLNSRGDWTLLSWGGNQSRKKRTECKVWREIGFVLTYTQYFCYDCPHYGPHELWDTWQIGINLGLGYFNYHHEIVKITGNCEMCSILKKVFCIYFLTTFFPRTFCSFALPVSLFILSNYVSHLFSYVLTLFYFLFKGLFLWRCSKLYLLIFIHSSELIVFVYQFLSLIKGNNNRFIKFKRKIRIFYFSEIKMLKKYNHHKVHIFLDCFHNVWK